MAEPPTMALAFALDPVVAGIKERHLTGLTRIADALLSDAPKLAVGAIAAEATFRGAQSRAFIRGGGLLSAAASHPRGAAGGGTGF